MIEHFLVKNALSQHIARASKNSLITQLIMTQMINDRSQIVFAFLIGSCFAAPALIATHGAVVAAPAFAHHAPIVAAPAVAVAHHAPVIAHAPITSYSYTSEVISHFIIVVDSSTNGALLVTQIRHHAPVLAAPVIHAAPLVHHAPVVHAPAVVAAPAIAKTYTTVTGHVAHAPLVAHAAPVVAHAAPVVAHAAPVVAHAAPVVAAHAPLLAAPTLLAPGLKKA